MSMAIYKIDNQQDLLYSIGKSTQWSIITYMGKESLKIKDTWICITKTNIDVHWELTRNIVHQLQYKIKFKHKIAKIKG